MILSVFERMRRRRAATAALLIACALTAPLAATAQGRNLTLASGAPGGTYHEVWAVNLVALLTEYHMKIRQTRGSLENLELLADRQADIAFAQADVYASRLRDDEARYGGITVIGQMRDECIYLARRTDGAVSALGSLKDEIDGHPARIAVGPEGSGMHATWSFFRELDPDLAAAEVLDTSGTLALNHLSLGMVDAVGWVTDPTNLDHLMLRGVLANDELELLPIGDAKLEHSLASGTRIYEVEPIEVSTSSGLFGLGKKSEKLRTLCTSALILARPEANPRLVEAVSGLLSFKREQLLKER